MCKRVWRVRGDHKGLHTHLQLLICIFPKGTLLEWGGGGLNPDASLSFTYACLFYLVTHQCNELSHKSLGCVLKTLELQIVWEQDSSQDIHTNCGPMAKVVWQIYIQPRIFMLNVARWQKLCDRDTFNPGYSYQVLPDGKKLCDKSHSTQDNHCDSTNCVRTIFRQWPIKWIKGVK